MAIIHNDSFQILEKVYMHFYCLLGFVLVALWTKAHFHFLKVNTSVHFDTHLEDNHEWSDFVIAAFLIYRLYLASFGFREDIDTSNTNCKMKHIKSKQRRIFILHWSQDFLYWIQSYNHHCVSCMNVNFKTFISLSFEDTDYFCYSKWLE